MREITPEQAIQWVKKNRKYLKLRAIEEAIVRPENTLYRVLNGKSELSEMQHIMLVGIMVELRMAIDQLEVGIFLIEYNRYFSLNALEAGAGMPGAYLHHLVKNGRPLPDHQAQALHAFLDKLLLK